MSKGTKLWRDYIALVGFALRLLDPDDLGHAVTEEVRNVARDVLGLPKVGKN